jgi:hypothetical protein
MEIPCKPLKGTPTQTAQEQLQAQENRKRATTQVLND